MIAPVFRSVALVLSLSGLALADEGSPVGPSWTDLVAIHPTIELAAFQPGTRLYADRSSRGQALHWAALQNQVDALRARNEELVAELEALRRNLAARAAAAQPANKLPVLHQAVGLSMMVWRRGG